MKKTPAALGGPGRQHQLRQTNPMVWCLAIVCAIVTILVILAGMAVFIGYMVARPKVPQMSVSSARIDNIYYDMVSILTVRIIVVMKAENDNDKASAYFYHTKYALTFYGVKVAYLSAAPFMVPRNQTYEMQYVVESSPIPLTPEEAGRVGEGLKDRALKFELKGDTKTRWKVWLVGSVKFWLHLDCVFKLPINKTTVYPKCSTKSRSR